jgi:hypothetical protein
MRLLLASLCACSAPQAPREPACHADAKIVLRGQDDVAAAARCLTIASLEIRTGAELDLAPLAKLHVILGALRVGPSVGFIQLQLPELYSAGSITIAGNGDLHGIVLPKLTSVGEVTIESNVALTTVMMPRLAKAGSIAVVGHAELGLVELSSLVTIDGALRVQDNPQLTLLELARLERAGSVQVGNNGTLDPAIVDAVRSKVAP